MSSAYGQLLSDKTGLVNRLDVESGGHTFEVEIVSNFDVTDYEFNKQEKRLTLLTNSGLENNLAELSIPQLLLGGNFTFFLNDVELHPKIQSSEKISFITLNFSGTGENKLDIIGTKTISEVKETIDEPVIDNSEGGCLIATATFGSEFAPQVQQLRELRDNTVLSTQSGTVFMTGFNQLYYSFSPTIADLEREYPLFKETVKVIITPMLSSLSILNYAEIDSEHEMLGYGLSVLVLNLGMYFGIPAFIIIKLKNIW